MYRQKLDSSQLTLCVIMVSSAVQVSEAQKGVGSNHAVSGLKFRILRPVLDMGFAVLLSDVDIVTLQDPFLHLHRDCDVEGMSDGWDNGTAYGEAHLQFPSGWHILCANIDVGLLLE